MDYEIVQIVVIFLNVVLCIVFGAISKRINESKGYYGGFAWGFWLGIIGIVIVACRQSNYSSYSSENYEYRAALSSLAAEETNSKLLRDGGWKCFNCKRVNAKYIGTCSCGLSAVDSKKKYNEEATRKQEEDHPEIQLAKYKKMFDEGIITEDEYQAKRKQILKL